MRDMKMWHKIADRKRGTIVLWKATVWEIQQAVTITSAVFKAPQHLQLRVDRRPCKGPRVDTKGLKKIYMNFELPSHVLQ